MRILRRYLGREIFSASLLALAAFLALFTFFDFLGELERLGKGDYRLKHILIYVLLSVPSRAYEVMPIAVLIGTLYALTQLARGSEIAVMRASGVSLRNFLAALGAVGMLFVATTFVLGEYIAPPLERVAQKWRLRSTHSAVSQQLRSGMWVRDGVLFVNVGEVKPDSRLERVTIYEFDSERRLLAVSTAATGAYSPGDGWLLTDVAQTRFGDDQVEKARYPTLRWESQLTPEIISVVMVVPERMAIGSLYRYVQHLEENGQQPQRYAVALWKKLTYPLACLVMMALALPFAFLGTRNANVSARVMLGVMLGVGFHLLNSLFSNLGVINAWSPPLAALAPSVSFLCAAIGVLWLTGRR